MNSNDCSPEEFEAALQAFAKTAAAKMEAHSCECILQMFGQKPVKFMGTLLLEPVVEREEWSFAA